MYIHTYVRTYIRTYVHTYVHTQLHEQESVSLQRRYKTPLGPVSNLSSTKELLATHENIPASSPVTCSNVKVLVTTFVLGSSLWVMITFLFDESNCVLLFLNHFILGIG